MVAGESDAEDLVVGEPRWHMASAVVAAIVLTIMLPDDLQLGPGWLLPAYRRRVARRCHRRRPGEDRPAHGPAADTLVGLISVLVLGALWATALLISHLIKGGKETNSAGALLEAGSIVWASNIIAFALLYWELDSGGSAARAHNPPGHTVDLAFPQQMNPALAPAHWRPRFHRLPLSGFHQRDRVQPDGCHAARAVGEDDHGPASADLARRSLALWSPEP